MNRNLFGLIVMLGIVMIFIMASCESKSGNLSNTERFSRAPHNPFVKIVLVKEVKSFSNSRQFKAKKIGDSSVYFWSTTLPYEVGDTVSTTVSQLKQ